MEVIILPDEDQVAHYGAEKIIQHIRKKPHSVLGLATGGTPIAIYNRLITAYQHQQVSFAHATSFNLDEYVGLGASHPQSYRYFMDTTLFQHIDINKKNTHVPDGTAINGFAEAKRYDLAIAQAGGIDLQLLGLGGNGHIGFNEPSSSLVSRTRVKSLAQQTIKDNSRFFKKGETQPHLCITMGIGTIMESREILMIVTGENKADAVVNMIEGGVSAWCPASILQMHHNVTIVLDEGASHTLQMQHYYKIAHKNSIAYQQQIQGK